MVMNAGSGPRRLPLMQEVEHLDAAKELIRASESDDFITVLNFLDPQQAFDFSQCIYKCRRHGLKELEKKFWYEAKSLVAVKGRRSEMYAQTIAKLIVPEFFGGNKQKSNNDHEQKGGNS